MDYYLHGKLRLNSIEMLAVDHRGDQKSLRVSVEHLHQMAQLYGLEDTYKRI